MPPDLLCRPMSRSGGMADAAVSKTVEGQPHVGSTPTFGITGIWHTHRAFIPEGRARVTLMTLTAGPQALLDPCRALF